MKTRLIISILSLMLISCETVVEIDLPERDSDITVNALFNTQEKIRATVSASKGTLEAGQIAPINNATVTIEGSDGTNVSINKTTIDLETKSEYYELSMTAKPNVDYTISVSATGFETVTARSSIVAPAPIIAVDTATTISDGLQTSQISLTLDDRANEQNFYELKFYALVFIPDTLNGQFVFTPVTQELYAVPANVDDFFGEKSDELLFSDELFDGNQYTQRINYDYFPPYTGVDSISNDSTDLQSLFSSYLISELRTLSQEYYLFQTSYTTYQFSNGDPFAQPVQVYNNIDGGFGIFAGYSSSFDTLRVTKGLFPSPID